MRFPMILPPLQPHITLLPCHPLCKLLSSSVTPNFLCQELHSTNSSPFSCWLECHLLRAIPSEQPKADPIPLQLSSFLLLVHFTDFLQGWRVASQVVSSLFFPLQKSHEGWPLISNYYYNVLAQSRYLINIWWIQKWRWLHSESRRRWEDTEPPEELRGTTAFPATRCPDADPPHPGGGSTSSYPAEQTAPSSAHQCNCVTCKVHRTSAYIQTDSQKITFTERNTQAM